LAGSASEPDHALGDLPRGFAVAHVPQQYGEFVAAETGDRVALLRAGLEPMRNDGQQLVARAVAERIVDALEVIQVDIHERAAREPGGRRRQLLRQAIAKQCAIGQLRERIVVAWRYRRSSRALLESAARSRSAKAAP
jgi:hypothetical protein